MPKKPDQSLVAELNIETVTAKEIQQLADFGRDTFYTAFAADNNPADIQQYLDESFHPDQIQREWSTKGTTFYFARLAGQLVGYLKLNYGAAQSEPLGENAFEIERIYVHAGYQGKGLGKQLMTFALKRAKESNVAFAWLGVWEKNVKAIAFYQQLGFEEFDRHIYTVGQDPQLDLMMRQVLHS